MNEQKDSIDHILYLTGISLDKRRLSDILAAILHSNDSKIFLDAAKAFADEFVKSNKVEDYTNIFNKYFLHPFSHVIDHVSGGSISILMLIKELYDEFKDKDKDFLKVFASYLFGRKKEFDRFLSEQTPYDLFNVYFSNQSDARGVSPLSVLGSKYGFLVSWAYCDKLYYENIFIKDIKLQFHKKLLNKFGVSDPNAKATLAKLCSKVYLSHILDIMISRHVGITTKPCEPSIFSFISLGINNQSELLKALKDRNLFGISLLSQILYLIKKYLIFEKDLIIKIDVENKRKPFIEELCITAGPPSGITFSDEDPHISIIEMTDEKSSTNSSAKNNTYSNHDKCLEKFNNYIDITNDRFVLTIPIQMIISLPLALSQDTVVGIPSRDILIPERLMNEALSREKDKPIDIVAVGGAEHNRPLMHLINRHRILEGCNRRFGFLDNCFDLEDRIKRPTDKKSILFLMATNQSVSGFNNIFIARDEIDRLSVSSMAEHLFFKIDNLYICCIYGFSATASGLSIMSIVSEIDRHIISKDNMEFPSVHKFFSDKLGHNIAILEPVDYFPNTEHEIDNKLNYMDRYLAFSFSDRRDSISSIMKQCQDLSRSRRDCKADPLTINR